MEEKAKANVSDEKLRKSTIIITSIEDCIKPIERYFKAGSTKVHIQSISPNEMEIIGEFGKIIPVFRTKQIVR